MSYAQTETDRRLGNVVQIGRVLAIDPARGLAQVDLDGPLTDWIPWTTVRAGADRAWWIPEEGEQVVVVAPSGELANAVIIGCLFQDAHPEPADTPDVHRMVYKDGTVIEYDRAGHQYKIDVSASGGNVLVICNNATIQASDSVLIDTPETTCTGNLTVQKRLTYMGGMVGTTGGGAAATITGGVNFQGGELTHNGKDVGSSHTHPGDSGGTTGPPN
jgi:phage baseplate assembly protein V